MTERNIGDTVYCDFGQYGRIAVRIGKIVSISPTGVMKCDFDEKWPGNGQKMLRLFNKNGQLRSAESCYHKPFLIDRETYDRLKVRQDRNAKDLQVRSICNNVAGLKQIDANVIVELEKALELARELVG